MIRENRQFQDGIIPAMLNSLLALRSLKYDKDDPVVQQGLKAIDNFAIETEDTYRVQPCVSPVWDTALVMRSLVDSGMPADHPALVQAGEWLLQKQILDYGDWAVKNRNGKPGAWAFEFDNRFYPDVDDTAVVVMALHQVKLPNEKLKQQAIARAVAWIASMQCTQGGWAAFDLDNNQDWINSIPYGDLKAMIEATGRFPTDSIQRGIRYLVETQQPDGSWNEPEFTGTGFPCHFYLNYHLYRQHFPLAALGRFFKSEL